MQYEFPLASPLCIAFHELEDVAPAVRVRISALERFVAAELLQLTTNEARRAYWAKMAAFAAKNEANVAGIIAGRAQREARDTAA